MKRTLAALSFMLLSAASSQAADPFSLKDAVELGLTGNHGLKAARAATGAARKEIGMARGTSCRWPPYQ